MCKIVSAEKINERRDTRLIVVYGADNAKRFQYLYGPKPDGMTDEAYNDEVLKDVSRVARQHAGAEADPLPDAAQADHPLAGKVL
jgi:hypothetical protein